MSEERAGGGDREREEHFGRVVLQSPRQGLDSLDLYETHATYAPGLTCRGYYMHPTGYPTGYPIRPPVPMGVELSLDDGAFNAIYEMFGGAFGEGGSWDPDAPYSDSFVLGGLGADVNPVFFHAEVSAPLRLPDRTVWTGRLGGHEEQITEARFTEAFDFILEQYETIEPVTLLLVYLFFLVYYDRDGRRHAEECYQQALRLCGDAGNIKSLNTTSDVTGMTLRVDRSCQTECFERWHP